MEFEGQYLTKEEYIDLGGSTMEDMPFNLLEFEARRKIDIKTQNRLIGKTDIPQEVKLCEYALINSIKSYSNSINTASGNNVASENTDGYSISYLTPDSVRNIVISKNDELNDIIRTYLLEVIYENEHLMYVGVDK